MAGARQRRRGTAAMEFGLWFPAFVLIVLGVIDASLFLARQHALERSARAGAQVGAVTLEASDPASGADIEAEAIEAATRSLQAARLASVTQVHADWWQDANGYSWITVTVDTPYKSIVPGLTPFKGNQTASFTMFTQEQ